MALTRLVKYMYICIYIIYILTDFTINSRDVVEYAAGGFSSDLSGPTRQHTFLYMVRTIPIQIRKADGVRCRAAPLDRQLRGNFSTLS